MAFTPVKYIKGGVTRTANSPTEAVQLQYDGYVPLDPTLSTSFDLDPIPGEILIASSRDHANTAVPLTLGAYGYLNPAISVPPQDGPVALFFGANVICTTAGTGIIGIGVADCSDGTLKQQYLASRGGTFALGTFAPLLGTVEGTFEIDPSPNWRHYRLIGAVFRDSGSLAASMGPSRSAGAPSYQPDDRAAYLRAVKL